MSCLMLCEKIQSYVQSTKYLAAVCLFSEVCIHLKLPSGSCEKQRILLCLFFSSGFLQMKSNIVVPETSGETDESIYGTSGSGIGLEMH